MKQCVVVLLSTVSTLAPFLSPIVYAQTAVDTILTVSICGDSIVQNGEDCDIPGEVGTYSTTIAGRQCNEQCQFGPYCGDGILQTTFGEECDDGNNEGNDFCGADCRIEPSADGGGGTSGGGSGGSGGSDEDIGDTSINIEGEAYPGRTVNILLDGESIGTVRPNSDGEFSFSTDADPGATTLGFWSTDNSGTRSITLSTTFDVTQGAVTNIGGILLPPTIRLNDQTVDPGDVITVSGQAGPVREVQIFIGDTQATTTLSGSDGIWSINLDTNALTPAEYLVKARYVKGLSGLRTESSFSTTLQLFVGVDGQPASNADLNRDGEVDLIDFSILLFWWQTNGGVSDPPADINGNGNVGLEDFSIMLFNWTG